MPMAKNRKKIQRRIQGGEGWTISLGGFEAFCKAWRKELVGDFNPDVAEHWQRDAAVKELKEIGLSPPLQLSLLNGAEFSFLTKVWKYLTVYSADLNQVVSINHALTKLETTLRECLQQLQGVARSLTTPRAVRPFAAAVAKELERIETEAHGRVEKFWESRVSTASVQYTNPVIDVGEETKSAEEKKVPYVQPMRREKSLDTWFQRGLASVFGEADRRLTRTTVARLIMLVYLSAGLVEVSPQDTYYILRRLEKRTGRISVRTIYENIRRKKNRKT